MISLDEIHQRYDPARMWHETNEHRREMKVQTATAIERSSHLCCCFIKNFLRRNTIKGKLSVTFSEANNLSSRSVNIDIIKAWSCCWDLALYSLFWLKHIGIQTQCWLLHPLLVRQIQLGHPSWKHWAKNEYWVLAVQIGRPENPYLLYISICFLA